MKNEIIVGTIAAILASTVTYFVSSARDSLTRLEIKKIASEISNDEAFLEILLDDLSDDERFAPKHGKDGISKVVPTGAVAAFKLSVCPSGWRQMNQAKGRYIVGLSNTENLMSTVGNALNDLENRTVGQHKHAYTDNLLLHPNGIQSHGDRATDTGNHITGEWRRNSGIRQTLLKHETDNTGSGGTNAPYIQLLICEKTVSE